MLWSEIVLIIFFLGLFYFVALASAKLFLPRHGRRHRLTGILYLFLLLAGVFQTCTDARSTDWRHYLAYDIILGFLGTVLTLTAAYDFKAAHSSVKNPTGIVSGTLSEKAIVSYDEMIEHSFYQGLNLVQAIYVHSVASSPNLPLTSRASLLLLVTSPWMLRSRFPVHSFSANYTASAGGSDPYTLINILYRTKKYQYLLYKHLLLHGLNVALAISPPSPHRIDPSSSSSPTTVGASREWRVYWLCLNTAYTMEFFLQTLVRRRHLAQRTMLSLNALLMAASTVAALAVVRQNPTAMVSLGLLSCLLNFVRRRHETQNVFACALVAWCFTPS